MWYQRYRMLLVAYGLALVFGVREYIVSKRVDTTGYASRCEASAAACSSVLARERVTDDTTFWVRHRDLTEVVAEVNPGDPDTEFLMAMQAMADGDSEESLRRIEHALQSGVKHNDYLLRYYAQFELSRGADWQRVNLAVNRWRENHPFSADPLYLPMGSGPANEQEERLVMDALSRIPWVGGASLEAYEQGGEERWRVALQFRPGREVDIRQAVEAVTLLSLTEEQRARFVVRCSTLTDCVLEPR